MSHIKRLLEEAGERKFRPTGDTICRKHVRDRFLLSQLSDALVASLCVVCGRDAVSRVDVDEVRDFVVAVIKTYRRRAIDELYLDKETESGFAIADSYIEDTAVVVDTFFEGAFDDQLLEYARSTLDQEWWFNPGVMWLEGAELYLYSWNGFRTLLRSGDVTLANLLEGGLDDPQRVGEPADGILPSDILPRLWELVDELDVVRSIPKSKEWIRALHVPTGEPLGASRLGTAPSDYSTENRMNRAGEPMFYGAADDETASLEVGKPKKDSQTVIGTWLPSRPLQVLDLVDLPAPPDLYDVGKAGLRWRLMFLADFAADVSRPVGHHERVEYRATQIFMDFLRTCALELDGIVYQSSRTGRACCALDVGNVDCVDADAPLAPGAGRLQLTLHEVRRRS